MTFEAAGCAFSIKVQVDKQRSIITCSTICCLNDHLFDSVRNIDLKCLSTSQRLNVSTSQRYVDNIHPDL